MLSMVKVPLICVPLRIVTVGAFTATFVPLIVRFGPRVALKVASKVWVPDSVWFSRTELAGQALPLILIVPVSAARELWVSLDSVTVPRSSTLANKV